MPQWSKGEDYVHLRADLVQAGWAPIPAKCGNGLICFEEFPELATNLADGTNSGVFSSQHDSRIRVFTRSIPDGQVVERVADER